MVKRCSTLIDFAENQLSLSLLGLSPLLNCHPSILHIHEFGPQSFSTPSTCNKVDHLVSGLFRLTLLRVPLRVALAKQNNSSAHYTKGTTNLLIFLSEVFCIAISVFSATLWFLFQLSLAGTVLCRSVLIMPERQDET